MTFASGVAVLSGVWSPPPVTREFPCEPQLAFLRQFPSNRSFAELRQLNGFLNNPVGPRVIVPIKERSLQIFGDEKWLESLLNTPIFRPERLDLKKSSL